MLRITIQEHVEAVTIKVEGRLAGAWVFELAKTWLSVKKRLSSRALSIDLRNLVSVDSEGKRMLRKICVQAAPKLITGDPWTQFIAEEVRVAAGPADARSRLNAAEGSGAIFPEWERRLDAVSRVPGGSKFLGAIRVLLHSTGFSRCPTLVRELALHAEPIDCGTARTLFSEGRMPDGLYIAQSWGVTVTVRSAAGKVVVIKPSPPGSLLGLAALIENTPNAVSAVARRNSEVGWVSRKSFARFIEAHPLLSLNVLQTFAAEFQTAMRSLVNAKRAEMGSPGKPIAVLAKPRNVTSISPARYVN